MNNSPYSFTVKYISYKILKHTASTTRSLRDIKKLPLIFCLKQHANLKNLDTLENLENCVNLIYNARKNVAHCYNTNHNILLRTLKDQIFSKERVR